ncbi:Ski complex subunit Rec14 [Malassezia nana]|uniref:Ski complex subunit Rec14 n=1 Tax=Malassezia nana TaxID=180528 RepID=A0AAF0J140_9BASI|nr:Ski complex subunit Rec14 [Malassezia nana]
MYLEEWEVVHEEAVWKLAWMQHGIVVARASGALDVMCVWPTDHSDVQEARIRQSIHDVHDVGIVCLSHSSNEALLLTNSMDGRVALWQWKEDQTLHSVAQTPSVRDQVVEDEPVRFEAWATALHPDGSLFAAAGEGATIALFSAAPETFGQALEWLPAEELDAGAYALTLQFNHQGDLLAMGTNTGSVYVWDMASRTQLLRISGALPALTAEHAEPVRTLSFSAPHTSFSDHLFVGCDDRTTTVHDVQAIRRQFHGHAITALQGHKGWILDVQAGGDGRIVATCSSDATVRLWDLGASPVACVTTLTLDRPICERPTSQTPEISTRLLAPGARFVVSGDDGTVRLYRNAGAGSS